jgi:hypothetical protein
MQYNLPHVTVCVQNNLIQLSDILHFRGTETTGNWIVMSYNTFQIMSTVKTLYIKCTAYSQMKKIGYIVVYISVAQEIKLEYVT